MAAAASAYELVAKGIFKDAAAQVDRGALPTIGQMISDQTGIQIPAETREEMARRYAPDL